MTPYHERNGGSHMNGAKAVHQPPPRINYCRRLLVGLMVIQLGFIIGMHLVHYSRALSSFNSVSVADSLQSFVGGEPSIALGRSSEKKAAKSYDSVDPNSLYTKSIKSSENLWDHSTVIPQWAKDYFQWHKEQMQQLNETSWKDMRFLVMQCLRDDHHCGGTADRLKPAPTMFMLANQTRRVLLIRWERPCKLENFLLPPQGGLDWRIPDWLEPQLPRRPFAPGMPISKRLAQSDLPVAMTRYQSWNAGSIWFNEQINGTGTTFEELYHEMWNMMFTPVPPVAALIQESMLSLGLSPGQYVSAHLRALYARSGRSEKQTYDMASNAVSCASKLNPGKPIYFATDSTLAVTLMESYAERHSRRIVSLQDDENPLHLEKAENWQNRHPSEYYATFRDLYLLGMGDCVAYNIGGFGNWGLLISKNSSCGMRYVTGDHSHRLIPCDWKDGEPESSPEQTTVQPVMFEPPIGVVLENKTEKRALTERFSKRTDDSTLPAWLAEYFQWHAEQRRQLTQENWESFKFLVMHCSVKDGFCGGTADRLKPIPAVLYQAYKSKRILLIYWTNPCRLEEFLVPPPGGLNWTLPSWMEPKLAGARKLNDLRRINKYIQTYKDVILRTVVQSTSGGLNYYEEWTNGTNYDGFYHEMFHTVFRPSPPVAKIISETMERLGLKPGEYAAAHLRGMYGRETRPVDETTKMAINAVNCASELRPGGPIFFAADSKQAVESVQAYAKAQSRPVVGLIHETEPLHLDRAANATSRPPSDFYSTFVDLYLLGESRCLSYNIGGFGTWGLLLGYNSSCGNRHVIRKKLKNCTWKHSQLQTETN